MMQRGGREGGRRKTKQASSTRTQRSTKRSAYSSLTTAACKSRKAQHRRDLESCFRSFHSVPFRSVPYVPNTRNGHGTHRRISNDVIVARGRLQHGEECVIEDPREDVPGRVGHPAAHIGSRVGVGGRLRSLAVKPGRGAVLGDGAAPVGGGPLDQHLTAEASETNV